MKKPVIYILSFIAICSVAINLFAFTSSTTSKKEAEAQTHIMVEIYEVPKYDDKGIHIHYGNGKNEFIPFKSFDESEHHDDNGDMIIGAINKLERDGYALTHVTSGGASNGFITKVFMMKR